MAGGYTPAFASLYTGTLYGKWPTAAVWASLLPLIDARGNIEMTHEAIAGMTGWPIELLRQGIAQLELPDPDSRSDAEEGRRLMRLDPSRAWGWRAVNVQKYREMASGRDQVADGRNAEKVRRYKERHRQTPEDTAGHQRTPQNTNSDSDSDSDKEKSKRGSGGERSLRSRRVPPEFSPDLDLARREIPDIDAEREAQHFRDYEFKTPRSDWPAAWRNWIATCRKRGDYARKDMGKWR